MPSKKWGWTASGEERAKSSTESKYPFSAEEDDEGGAGSENSDRTFRGGLEVPIPLAVLLAVLRVGRRRRAFARVVSLCQRRPRSFYRF